MSDDCGTSRVLVFDNEGGLADSTMSELRDITKLLKERLAQDKQLATLLESQCPHQSIATDDSHHQPSSRKRKLPLDLSMQVRLTYKLVSEENGWDLKKSFSDHQNTRVTCEIVQSVQGIGGSWGPGLIKQAVQRYF
ncbi:uncharacterized protein LOC134195018 isoform X1 [Corticium candelabrum]|uniref:uncharacterized protein LOC134195018 isoform X1 n=1 Tax=Corticium candelabrum TaxID=121492 RepID=UPI002E2705EA|nr:uncharacterized protein LOC134195018 isoform X1 [Corticium candelabrum]XP_062519999.1 uncharacterized protein LOC134195018 isoform X1 [Corticium candelabrum]